MAKEFGNVKGFDTAICYLSQEQKGDLLFLMAHKDTFLKESDKYFIDESIFDPGIIALASIYHANNEAE